MRRLFHLFVIAILQAVVVFAGPLTVGATPEPPQIYVDTTFVPPSGRTIAVRAGGDFQRALNVAQPGDVITLEAGATFTGPFTLPKKPGSGWIIVRTSAPDSSLPSPGTRVDPSYAKVMPKLEAASGSVITTAPAAHHYRFIGIEIRPKERTFLYNLVQLGVKEISMDQLPHHIIFDRCYLRGDPAKGTRRGIALNGTHLAVIDSYLADFKEVGADSQAIAGWNGSGPFRIVNNYLEGAGENVIFGGADPTIPDLVPSDIEIRRNHFAKPLSWKIGHSAYAGTPWSIKNLFELKNARRVLVDGNRFEYNWVHAQNGFAILFTVRNQGGRAPWSVVEDVTFTNNVVRHAKSGINILGLDDKYPSQRTKRILIKNNLFEDIGSPIWGGGSAWLFQLLRGTADVIIEHNTGIVQTSSVVVAEGEPHARFVFQNNLMSHGSYGIIGTGTGVGNHTLRKYFPDAVVKRNVFASVPHEYARSYPQGNFLLASLDEVGFVDRARGNYRLAPTSRYTNFGTDGMDVGVDFGALTAAKTGKTGTSDGQRTR